VSANRDGCALTRFQIGVNDRCRALKLSIGQEPCSEGRVRVVRCRHEIVDKGACSPQLRLSDCHASRTFSFTICCS
jgi:hypothetical protein